MLVERARDADEFERLRRAFAALGAIAGSMDFESFANKFDRRHAGVK